MFKKDHRLLLVAFLEGFTTLAFQMVALRKAVPFVGSSVVLTSVVIGIILLALSAGYFAGGVLTSRMSENNLMKRLSLYLIISGLYYLLIVYPSFDRVMQSLLAAVWFIPTLFIFALVFFAIPTFLASHTMPLITHVSQGTKGFAAGKILFVSTIGSFLGSTITTLVLFPHMWVFWTGILASVILLICSLLVGVGRYKIGVGAWFLILLLTIWQFYPRAQGRYEETPYQTIRIRQGKLLDGRYVRIMEMNGGWASGIEQSTHQSFFPYVKHIKKIIETAQPKTVAIIGAAGCTLPQEIASQSSLDAIDVIDIDKRVFSIATDHFLDQPLDNKIKPIAQSARGWIHDMIAAGKKYDMIVVDAYNGTALPEELITKEFFAWLKALSANVVMNVIADRPLRSEFSQRFLATVQSVLPSLFMYDASSTESDQGLWNIVFTTFPVLDMKPVAKINNDTLYTDDKNSADALRVEVMYGTP